MTTSNSPAKAAWERYRDERETFVDAAATASGILQRIASQAGISTDVEARAKDLSSFAKKCQKPKYADPWTQITDKVGARVIVSTLSDRHRMVSAVEGSTLFRFLSMEDKEEKAQADQLFYPGVHVQVALSGIRDSSGAEIECEIQIRTKAQDLWSVPSHKLIYKGALDDPPVGPARRIMRLSALVALFDEEVERAMVELAATPQYATLQLLHELEAAFLRFVPYPGDGRLSIEILEELVPELELDLGGYADKLSAFVGENEERLRQIYDQYGPQSAEADSWHYLILSQPESILLMEQLKSRPMLLSSRTLGSELARSVQTIAAIWGIPLPD